MGPETWPLNLIFKNLNIQNLNSMETFKKFLSNDKLTLLKQGDQLILCDTTKVVFKSNNKLQGLLDTIFVFDDAVGNVIRVVDMFGQSHLLSSERFVKIELQRTCVIVKTFNEDQRNNVLDIIAQKLYSGEYVHEYDIFIFHEINSFVLSFADELNYELNIGNDICSSIFFCSYKSQVTPYIVQ